ncbi:hypothetical protein MASR2M50_10600 [Thauera sp.]
MRATDEDGEHVLGTQAVTVENAAPSAVLGGADASDEGASYVLEPRGQRPGGQCRHPELQHRLGRRFVGRRC